MRIVFGALAGAALLGLASVASAQSGHVTYGQPTVQDYRHVYGGQVAVVETRQGAYSASGDWADGRSGYGYGYGYGHDQGGVGHGCRDRCGGGHYPPPPPPSCYDPCGGGYGYGLGGHAYSQTSHWSQRAGHWGRYQPYGRQDRGGRYGYSEGRDRRGYHDRDGYHDDRPPSGRDRRRGGGHDRGCDCHVVLDDR